MGAARNAKLRQTLSFGLLAGALLGVLSLARGARLEPADFTFNNSEISTLDPATQVGVPEGRVARAIFEGLVVLHPRTLEPLPGAARSWTISDDGLTHTFHLRSGAVWTNGDRLTAHDFTYSLERLLDPRTAAGFAYLLWYVRGARAFTTEVSADGVPVNDFASVGIHAPDDLTLVFELEAPTPFFLDILAYPATYPVNRRSIEEARERWPETWDTEWLRPEHLVSNGPFRVQERRINDRMRLVKWPGYWDADNVALRSIDVLAIEQDSTALNMYLTGSADFIERIHPGVAAEMMRREDYEPRPYLGTYFYRVNTTRPPLDDPRVRRALNLCLPREAICDRVLGMGQVPATALVPPVLSEYRERAGRANANDASMAVEGARETPTAEARALLAEAGYGPGGKTFPTIEIHYNTTEVHGSIAQIVAGAWRDALAIDVRLRNEEWKVFLDSQRALRFDISRASWICDYADPSSYLEIFVTDGKNNRTGWSDAEYDELIERAALEHDRGRRLELLGAAEAILLRELPILPIYFYVHQNVVAPRLGGFHHNALDTHFPKFFYWMDNAELAERRAAQPAGRLQVDPHGPPEGLYSPARMREREAR